MAKRKRERGALPTIWRCPDDLWVLIVLPVILALDPPAKTGRKRIDQRRAFDGVIYHLRTGCQWNQLPDEFGDDSSVHRTYQRWLDKGVLVEALSVLVGLADGVGLVDWRWQSVDGFLGKARHGGDPGSVGPNPTDRGKKRRQTQRPGRRRRPAVGARHRRGQRARRQAAGGNDRVGGGGPAPARGPATAPVPGQGLRQPVGSSGGVGPRLRAAHPQDRRGEAGGEGNEASPGAALGGRALRLVAQPLPGDPGALCQEGGEL